MSAPKRCRIQEENRSGQNETRAGDQEESADTSRRTGSTDRGCDPHLAGANVDDAIPDLEEDDASNPSEDDYLIPPTESSNEGRSFVLYADQRHVVIPALTQKAVRV